MCVDIVGIIVTLLYFTAGLIFNQRFVDFDNGEKFSIWLMLFWPVVVFLYIGVFIFTSFPYRIKQWFISRFKER